MVHGEMSDTIRRQRQFFSAHRTKDVGYRLDALKTLRRAILQYEKRISEALYADLRKSEFESYMTEIGIVLEELRMHIRNVKKWSRPKRARTKFYNYFASCYQYPEPYGVVLIMAPWNYPFQLLINPLIGALSAGNGVVLKPAEYSRNTSRVIAEMITEHFAPDHISIFTGGREINEALLQERYDYIFFTGSPALGKVIMERAAKNLTPVTLELGGKSPCIVHGDADIDLAARRIVWGKFLNAGQVCIAPDYVFVHKDVKVALLERMKGRIEQCFGSDARQSADYPRIINDQQFDRLSRYLESGTIAHGGATEKAQKYIAPTILTDIAADDPVMEEEIFGPILPVMEYERLQDVIEFVIARPKPLALYLFSRDKGIQQEIIEQVSFGGGCINETIMQITNASLPFGGVGNSGMGAYHGKSTFDTFTHYKSIVNKGRMIDTSLRYPPYQGKMGILRKIIG